MAPEYPSNILTYFLTALDKETPGTLDEYCTLIREVFDSEKGTKLLDLLEKAVMLSPSPADASDRALRTKNAQALLVGEIRRIVKHGRRR